MRISTSRWLLFILSLLFVIHSSQSFAGKVDSVMVYSKSMKKQLPCTIIIPANYNTKGNAYPVVYLLHGYTGWHSNWILRMPALSTLADSFQMIIVCPEGGYNSWYFDSPIDSASKFETFVAKEIPQYIDANYNTRKNRNGRAISGLSMGGHGALFLALRHTDIFGMAASMSGAVNLLDISGRFEINEKIGDTAYWNKYSVLQSIEAAQAKKIHLFIDCGVDDFLIGGNRALHKKMIELKIPHTYMEREGDHSWDYWRQSIIYHLVFFRQYFML